MNYVTLEAVEEKLEKITGMSELIDFGICRFRRS